MKDFYSILGVEHTATGQEIEQAYRKASLLLHPDKSIGGSNKDYSSERFCFINTIKDILLCEVKRKEYDINLIVAETQKEGKVDDSLKMEEFRSSGCTCRCGGDYSFDPMLASASPEYKPSVEVLFDGKVHLPVFLRCNDCSLVIEII